MDQTLALSLMLIGAGLLLLLCDLFFYSGFIAVVALVLIVVGVALPFYYGNTSTGVVTLLGVGAARAEAERLAAKAVDHLRDAGLVSPILVELAHYIVTRPN